ncbi:MAG TPA: hypothetical protein VGE05_11390 [Novosphingobium sp.]
MADPGNILQEGGLTARLKQTIGAVLGNGIMQDTQTRNAGEAQEVARGYLLICVFYIHAMIGVAQYMGDHAWFSLFQLKILAPNVSSYFFLSGMAAPHLAKKGLAPVLRQSLVLLLFAVVSHVVGFLIVLAGQGYATVWEAFKALVRPIVYGTGYVSFVAWFFVVLAVVRPLAYTFLRSKKAFVLLATVLALACWATGRLHLPYNLYEWRNWPTATLFFLIGMRLPGGWKIPNWGGVLSLALSVGLALINRENLFSLGPCLTCDPRFVAQPMVGQYGSIFIYVIQQIAFILFLIWGAQRSAGMMIGKVGRFFGQASLPILLLHGWVLLTLYPLIFAGMPAMETPFLFMGIFSAAVVAHALLYAWLKVPLNWLQARIFMLSHVSWNRKRPVTRRATST